MLYRPGSSASGARSRRPSAVDGREEAAAEVDRASRTPLTVVADDLTPSYVGVSLENGA